MERYKYSGSVSRQFALQLIEERKELTRALTAERDARYELSHLRELVMALPVVEWELSVVEAGVGTWGVVSRKGVRVLQVLQAGTKAIADGYCALLQYRATLPAQGAPTQEIDHGTN